MHGGSCWWRNLAFIFSDISHNDGVGHLETLTKMTDNTELATEQKIDANLDSVLFVAGLSLKHFPTQETIDSMRAVMLEIMKKSYVDGVNAGYNASIRLQRGCGVNDYLIG